MIHTCTFVKMPAARSSLQNASLDKVLRMARTLQRCTPLCTPLELPPIAACSNANHIDMYAKPVSMVKMWLNNLRNLTTRALTLCMADMWPSEEQGQWLTGDEFLPSFSIPMSAEGALASSSNCAGPSPRSASFPEHTRHVGGSRHSNHYTYDLHIRHPKSETACMSKHGSLYMLQPLSPMLECGSW